jgi:hypothetical protein
VDDLRRELWLGSMIAGIAACAQPSPSPYPGPTTAAAATTVATPVAAPATAVVSAAAPASASSPVASPASSASAAPSASSAQPPCVPGSAAPASLSDAQLFAEIKACVRDVAAKRGLQLLREAQRRLRGKSLTRDALLDKMGDPSGGEYVGHPAPGPHVDEIVTWTKGAFTDKTADAVLVWTGYELPVLWQFWWAVKDGRVIGSGRWDVVQD